MCKVCKRGFDWTAQARRLTKKVLNTLETGLGNMWTTTNDIGTNNTSVVPLAPVHAWDINLDQTCRASEYRIIYAPSPQLTLEYGGSPEYPIGTLGLLFSLRSHIDSGLIFYRICLEQQVRPIHTITPSSDESKLVHIQRSPPGLKLRG